MSMMIVYIIASVYSTIVESGLSNVHNTTNSYISISHADDMTVYIDNSNIYTIYGDTITKVGTISNGRDVSCYKSKCIVSYGYSTYVYTVDNYKMTLEYRYPMNLHSTDKCTAMKNTIIYDTSYFISASDGEYGLNRYMIGNHDTHTVLYIDGISDTDTISSLHSHPHSSYTFASYKNNKHLHAYDHTSNVHLHTTQSSSYISHISSYTYDAYRYMMIYAYDAIMIVKNYISHINDDVHTYSNTISYMMTPYNSVHTYVCTSTNVYIYSIYTHTDIYSKSHTSMYIFSYNVQSAYTYQIYNNSMYRSSYTSSLSTYCHPSCILCSSPLSNYKCTECNMYGVTVDSTSCNTSISYTYSSFTSDTTLTTKFGNEYIYLCVAIGCLILLWGIVYCIYITALQQMNNKDGSKVYDIDDDEIDEVNNNKDSKDNLKDNEGRNSTDNNNNVKNNDNVADKNQQIENNK